MEYEIHNVAVYRDLDRDVPDPSSPTNQGSEGSWLALEVDTVVVLVLDLVVL
jgi:hypothetical protein